MLDMKKIKCVICKYISQKFFSYNDYYGNQATLLKCINCGHGFHEKKYSQAQFDRMYAEQYSKNYLDYQRSIVKKRKVQYKYDIDWLLHSEEKIRGKKLKVLDLGCSSGDYLETMPKNWKKFGYEVNDTYVQHIAQKKHNIITFQSLKKPIKEKFNLITMRGVIEHIQDHKDLLNFLERNLLKNGLLYISSSPDFSSICAIQYKQLWNQMKCPEHIHHFTFSSLSILLSRVGLVPKHMNHNYINTPYSNWKQDKITYIKNISRLNKKIKVTHTEHAFLGNMIQVIYEKVI